MRFARLRSGLLIMSKPDLSIVIPTLNEELALPHLLDDLARQHGLSLQVIIADGGSVDRTCQLAEQFFELNRLLGSCHTGPSGRGRQLNAGALLAQADWILFLHADSRLSEEDLLQSAFDFMLECQEKEGTDNLAGRFTLRFDMHECEDGFGLFFYEAKAALGRPGCIHGDQGMLMTKSLFQRIGPFREDLPVMEDTSLAEVIRQSVEWKLLPTELNTSVRRFQTEGMKPRQTLNALMMNFLAIGWFDFFDKAPDLYRQQDRSQPLQLGPFFILIRDLLKMMPLRKRCQIWMDTGGYVRSQAWQIGLAMDCRKAFKQGLKPGEQGDSWLKWFDLYFDPTTNHCVGRAITALLVRVWFSWQLFKTK